LINKLENASSDSERAEITKEMDTYKKKDWLAPWYISQMIFYVEHDLADGRDGCFLVLRMSQIEGTLNSDSYYTNVFNDEDCEETRNYKELGRMTRQAIKMLS
jgi:hypothetical protein